MKQKKPDLANMFYHKNTKSSDGSSPQHASKQSIPTLSRSNVSAGLNQPQQFTLTKKINMMQNTDKQRRRIQGPTDYTMQGMRKNQNS